MSDSYSKYKLCTPCLVCGETILINSPNETPRICPECIKAIKWARVQMKDSALTLTAPIDPTFPSSRLN